MPKPGMGKGWVDVGTGRCFSLMGCRKQALGWRIRIEKALEFHPSEGAWMSSYSQQAGGQQRFVIGEWGNPCISQEIGIRTCVRWW